jgi:hypothetical protein
MLMMDKLKK